MEPDVPDGPLTSGAPYWYWLGGRPALDLVNTRRERWRRNVECLTSDRDAADWLVAAELLPRASAAPRGLVSDAQELREAIDVGVRAAVAGRPADPAAVALIDEWLELAGSRPSLALGADGLPVRRGGRRGGLAAAGARPGRARCRAHARHGRGAGADPHLRLRHLLGALLRPLARRAAPLVFDAGVRKRREGPAPSRREPTCAMSGDVQSGLEGVVAFATEIAEPDREGGALRYRGVDIEELVGKVPFEQVWGLLVDGALEPGLPPAEPHPLAIRSGDPRVDVQSALAMLGPEWGFAVADRHLRRAGARRPRPRLGDGALASSPSPRAAPAARPCRSARSTRRPRSPSAS